MRNPNVTSKPVIQGEIGMKFQVPDMSCGHCTAAIEKALKTADPKAEVHTDLEAKTVTVVSSLDTAVLQTTLENAGYPAKPAA
jgi:copper chaperone